MLFRCVGQPVRIETRISRSLASLAVLLGITSAASADILRWDNSKVISGTQGITLGPGVDLTTPTGGGRNLSFANLVATDLSAANFTGANLSHARFNALGGSGGVPPPSFLANTNFTGANISFANFGGIPITSSQFGSTKSYTQHNLTGVGMQNQDMTGWDLSLQNLSKADLHNATLTGANLTGANIAGANLGGSSILTPTQLYSTKSYQRHNLSGVGLSDEDLQGFDFQKQNLKGSNLSLADLANANFTKANIKGANFRMADNFMPVQLYSTGNYKSRNLSQVGFSGLDMSGWILDKQNVTSANFQNADLSGAHFTSANLTKANLNGARLAGAILTKANLTKTNLSDADLRGVGTFTPKKNTLTTNTIFPDGSIHGLSLGNGETLPIHNNALPVTVFSSALFNPGSDTHFLLEDHWTSPLGFALGVQPDIQGNLDLDIAPGQNPDALDGMTFQVFNWPGSVTPALGGLTAAAASAGTTARFATITTDPSLDWDLANLYTDGTVTVHSIASTTPPEACTLGLLSLGVMVLLKRRTRPIPG